MTFPYPTQNTTRSNTTARKNNLRDDINAHAAALNDLLALLGDNPEHDFDDVTACIDRVFERLNSQKDDIDSLLAGNGGAKILSGSGAPSGTDGRNGDFYIRTTNPRLYGPKASGSWGAGVSLQGADGPAGAGIPVEGTGAVGEFLRLKDDDPVTAEWKAIHQVPAGGTTGQALVKATGDDFDTEWADVSGGGGGSLPDPAGEPDGKVLTTLTGGAVWAAPSGGGGGGGGTPAGIRFHDKKGYQTKLWESQCQTGYGTLVPECGWVTVEQTDQRGWAWAPTDPLGGVFDGGRMIASTPLVGVYQRYFYLADYPMWSVDGDGLVEIRGGTAVTSNINEGIFHTPFVLGSYVYVVGLYTGNLWRRALLGAANSWSVVGSGSFPNDWSRMIVGNGSVAWGVAGGYDGIMRLLPGATSWTGGFSFGTGSAYTTACSANGNVWAVNGTENGTWYLATATPLTSAMVVHTGWVPDAGMPYAVRGIGVAPSGLVVLVCEYWKSSDSSTYRNIAVVYDPSTGAKAEHYITTPAQNGRWMGTATINGGYTEQMAVRESDGMLSFSLLSANINLYATVTVPAAV